MNILKSFILVSITVLFCVNAFAWDQTGHMIAARIAYQDLTAKTKSDINLLLKKEITKPVPVEIKAKDDSFLICAAAPWADSIKYTGTWKKPDAEKFYADAHTMHSKILFDDPSKITPEKAVSDEVKRTGNANSIKVIDSCIKTLTSKTSDENYKAIALRFLIHLVADQTQPLHVAYIYLKDKKGDLISPNGADMIRFSKPSDIVARYAGKEEKAYYLHGYWDLAGGLYNSVPMGNNVLYLDNKQEAYIDNQAQKYSNDFKNMKKQLTESCSTDDWAVDTYKTAVKYAAAPDLFKNSKLESKGKLIINTPDKKYQKAAQKTSEMQLYKAGIRLGSLLNAVYNPENAPKAYVKYVNQIKNDPKVLTLKQMQPLY